MPEAHCVVRDQTGHIVRQGTILSFLWFCLLELPPRIYLFILWTSEDNLWELILSFHFMGLGEPNSSWQAYLVSHFTSTPPPLFLELKLQPGLTSKLKSSCFNLWSSGIVGTWHHIWLFGVSVKAHFKWFQCCWRPF